MDKLLWQQLKPILEVALSLNGFERDDYLSNACIGNANLYNEALKLLANESAETLSLTNTIQDFNALPTFKNGQQIGHYKLIEELGSGGMGAVFLAERTDGEYDQKVAVKILQNGRSSELLIQKLRNERQILANLKHTNIVNILDGGTTEYGIPYIVMEYVDGTIITDYIEEKKLTIRQKLKLFQKLCDVIIYAHQKLIIHRDIKPSNILISKTGEIKLLDFGIAKILDEQGLSTQDTQQSFITPDYASPEHIKGLPLTISSEVYGLGILLYEILAGFNPFKFGNKSIEDAIRTTCEYNPPPPSKSTKNVNYELKGDIDNICMKALYKDPKDRYLTVDYLSQDIERYFNNEPVKATKDKWWYRTKKFIKRNKSYLITGICIFAITLAGLFSSLHQAKKTKVMFTDLRGLTSTMLFDFYDGIANIEGTTEVKEMVVSKTIAYLNKMEKDNADNPDLMNDISDGYQRLGNIQGNSYFGNMGLSEDAFKSYIKAVKISEKLVAKNPNNQKYIFSLSQAYIGIGDINYTLSKLDTALIHYEKGYSILQKLANQYTDSLHYYWALSNACERIGDVSGMYGYPNLGNTSKAVSSYTEMANILEKIVTKEPKNARYRSSYATAQLMLGNLFNVLGRFNEAINSEYKAITAFDTLLINDPNNYNKITSLLNAKNTLREPLTELMKYDEALLLLTEVNLRLNKSMQADPNNSQVQSNLANNYNSLGRVLNEKGFFNEAMKAFEKSKIINQQLLKNEATNMEVLRNLGFTIEFMGDNYFYTNKYSEAKQKYNEAISIYVKIDTGLINFTQIKKNICKIYLKENNQALLLQHKNNLMKLEKESMNDTLNIRNIALLSEVYANTAIAIATSKNAVTTNDLYNPCYYYNLSKKFTDMLKLRNAFSPLRMKKAEVWKKVLPLCIN